MTPLKTRILVADDHAMVRRGLRRTVALRRERRGSALQDEERGDDQHERGGGPVDAIRDGFRAATA